MSRVIAIVGAESTGKTTLAADLAEALTEQGHRVAQVGEYLREFCIQHARTPRRDEQAAIAAEQTQRIEAAAATHDIVLADTSAVMPAVYREIVFGDRSLYAEAEATQRRYALTLLTALDLPWVADGLQRDGAHVREPVTTLVRASLARAGVSYSVVGGMGTARRDAALAAIAHTLLTPADPKAPRWHWVCDRCGDTQCERHERHLLPPG